MAREGGLHGHWSNAKDIMLSVPSPVVFFPAKLAPSFHYWFVLEGATIGREVVVLAGLGVGGFSFWPQSEVESIMTNISFRPMRCGRP